MTGSCSYRNILTSRLSLLDPTLLTLHAGSLSMCCFGHWICRSNNCWCARKCMLVMHILHTSNTSWCKYKSARLCDAEGGNEWEETPHRAQSFHPPSHTSFHSARLADGQEAAMKGSVQPTQQSAAFSQLVKATLWRVTELCVRGDDVHWHGCTVGWDHLFSIKD